MTPLSETPKDTEPQLEMQDTRMAGEFLGVVTGQLPDKPLSEVLEPRDAFQEPEPSGIPANHDCTRCIVDVTSCALLDLARKSKKAQSRLQAVSELTQEKPSLMSDENAETFIKNRMNFIENPPDEVVVSQTPQVKQQWVNPVSIPVMQAITEPVQAPVQLPEQLPPEPEPVILSEQKAQPSLSTPPILILPPEVIHPPEEIAVPFVQKEQKTEPTQIAPSQNQEVTEDVYVEIPPPISTPQFVPEVINQNEPVPITPKKGPEPVIKYTQPVSHHSPISPPLESIMPHIYEPLQKSDPVTLAPLPTETAYLSTDIPSPLHETNHLVKENSTPHPEDVISESIYKSIDAFTLNTHHDEPVTMIIESIELQNVHPLYESPSEEIAQAPIENLTLQTPEEEILSSIQITSEDSPVTEVIAPIQDHELLNDLTFGSPPPELLSEPLNLQSESFIPIFAYESSVSDNEVPDNDVPVEEMQNLFLSEIPLILIPRSVHRTENVHEVSASETQPEISITESNPLSVTAEESLRDVVTTILIKETKELPTLVIAQELPSQQSEGKKQYILFHLNQESGDALRNLASEITLFITSCTNDSSFVLKKLLLTPELSPEERKNDPTHYDPLFALMLWYTLTVLQIFEHFEIFAVSQSG